MPRCASLFLPVSLSSLHFPAVENGDGVFFFRRVSRDDDRSKRVDERAQSKIINPPSPTAILSVTASQEYVPPCPFLETRSLSLPTHSAAPLPPPILRSRPVSPGLTCLILGQWQRSSQRCCFWRCACLDRHIVLADALAAKVAFIGKSERRTPPSTCL